MQNASPLSQTSAIILSAGPGSRLGDITANIPKPMLQFGGKPFLGYLIDWLLIHGVHDIVVTAAWHSDQVTTFVSHNYSHLGRVKVVLEPTMFGTPKATLQALEHIRRPTTFLLTADNLWEVQLEDMYDQHVRFEAKATILATARPGVPNLGAVKVRSADDMIMQMWSGKDGGAPEEPRLIPASTMGLYLFEREALADAILPEDTGVEREPCNRLMPGVYAHWCEGFFFDYGTPKNYQWLIAHPEVIEQYTSLEPSANLNGGGRN